MAIKRIGAYSSQEATCRRQGATDTRKVSSQYKNNIFMCENIHSLEQPPQRHGRLPITGVFQDAVEQGAR